eukprot:1141566-Pelagomonas_calceolata.AAC.3
MACRNVGWRSRGEAAQQRWLAEMWGGAAEVRPRSRDGLQKCGVAQQCSDGSVREISATEGVSESRGKQRADDMNDKW